MMLMSPRLTLSMHAGVNELRVTTDELAPGIYLARVQAFDRSEVVQFVIR
jgi:hypothetical protein